MIDRAALGQGTRFAIAGACVAGVYFVATLTLANVVGLHFQLALAIGLVIAIVTHFLAQRLFVYRHEDGFELPVEHQAGRYLAVTLVQYALSALSTAVLPRALGLRTDVVYVGTTVLLTLLTFLVLRRRVFHAAEPA